MRKPLEKWLSFEPAMIAPDKQNQNDKNSIYVHFQAVVFRNTLVKNQPK
jgi:hypothetical protein